MSTAAKKSAQPTAQEPKPTLSFVHVIQVANGTGSFSGWGPKVGGTSNLLKNWN